MTAMWRVLIGIVLIGAFIYLGGGRVVVQGGNGLIKLGEGMARVERLAKDRVIALVEYISERGQKRVEKTLRQKEREEQMEQGGEKRRRIR